MTMQRFADTTAVVTGAGSGLGAATARRLAAEGAAVACLDVASDAAAATAAAIRESGGRARAYSVDVADAHAVRAAIGAAAGDVGRPGVVVNCAGIGRFYHSHDMPPAEWQRIIAVNLTGTFFVCQAALPFLLDGGGSIVNIASNAGLMAQPYSAAYCASKGGVVMMTKALAVEYGRKGVRINCVCPGGIETPMIGQFKLPDGVSEAALAKIMPLGRFGQAHEVAGTIAFLCSEDAMYINGAAIVIDGGMIA